MPSSGWTSSQGPASSDSSRRRTGVESSCTADADHARVLRVEARVLIRGGALSTSNEAVSRETVSASARGLPGASEAVTRSW